MAEDLSRYLETAIEAARAAEAVINRYYHGDFEVERKADASPVTIADVECERAIKRVLSDAFPDHGFYGEELGRESIDADYVWLIDPIDGTKSFVRGYPFFSTQIALRHQGELIVGVSNAPAFGNGDMAWAARGQGAFLNGEPIHVSAVDEIAEASLSLGNIAALGASPAWAKIGELAGDAHRIRGYGDFYHYHLLASGAIDAIIESDLNILDIAALTVIVREAGGDVTELGGGPIDLESCTVMATNRQLRPQLVPYLAAWDEQRDAPGG
ncbi:inositol monophosphatase family protein [Salinisphaera sp. LB1]|uniref:inositol monophosphatase family protein n=1 Tax=Salinisphaera sp. LB1 TaxID=2183911 RepID=UPI000D7E6585|nr:inositol monophosphatase family protein [Salinisphaera sp. LB1]AWN15900.1 Histidinol-phosphatase [alternative form] [Salinisphaera sp. LB1]